MIGKFSAFIEELELIDFPLLGRRFPWCNEREHATHTRIDRVLVTKDWDLSFPQYQLSPASTSSSDHCPIILKKMQTKRFSGFRFENFWLRSDGFADVVAHAWTREVRSADCARILHTKLCRIAAALKMWNRSLVREMVWLSNLANEIILGLDIAQEERDLTDEERQLRSFLKDKLLGFAAIDRSKWLKEEGNANTKLFHLKS
ncbi:hypothetical protein ACQ4PT_015733 [Festuca glaucescens]